MKRCLIFVFVTFLVLEGCCQFNDSINYHLLYASTGMVNKTTDGNSYNLNNSIKFNLSRNNIFVNSASGWVYGKQSNKEITNLTNNDFTSVIDFNLYKAKYNYNYWALAGYDKSYSLKILDRIQAGVGIGYSLLNKENIIIGVSNGILYEKNKLYDIPENEILRNSFRLKFRFVYKSIIVLDGINFLQNSLAWEKDYVIKSVTNLSFKLNKLLSLTSTLNYNKLNLTRKENLLITFGLNLEKYF